MAQVNKTYLMVPQSGAAGEVRGLCYRETFTAAPIDALNDTLDFWRMTRGTKILDAVLEFSANDGGAGAGRVDVIVTDGTTTYTLIKAADISAAGVVRAGNGAGALDWLGKVLSGTGQWVIGLKVSTALSAAVAAGHYALAVTINPNPSPDLIT